jgi:cell division septal protein FtsQ
MWLTTLQKALARLIRKKKPGYTNFSSDINIRGAAAESSRSKRWHRLSKFRQRFQAKQREQPQGYGRPVPRSRALYRVLTGLAVVGLVTAGWLLGGDQLLRRQVEELTFFRVSKIEVSGCTAVAREKVIEASGIVLRHSNLLTVDIAASRESIAKVPWVARAEVKRNWPGKIVIAIEENAPVALLHGAGGEGSSLRYLDGAGTAFSEASLDGDIDFPVITGWAELTDREIKDKVMAEILAFLKKVRSNDPHLPAQSLSEVHITPSGEMVLYLVEYPFPIFFGNGNSEKKYSRLIQVLRVLYKKPNGKELLAQIAYIQMDYLNDKVLVVERTAGRKSNG